MIKRKPPAGKIVSVVAIGLLCAALIVESVCYMELHQERAQLRESNQEYLKKNRKLESKCTELETKNEELSSQVEAQEREMQTLLETQTKAEASEEASAEPEPEEGSISPSSANSIFSDENMKPGNIISMENLVDWDSYFQESMISRDGDIFQRINGRSWQDNENIALEDLRYLKFPYYNFDHEIQVGEMIVNAAITEDVRNIFRELFYIEYEIESIRLVDDYWTPGKGGGYADYSSIEHNNTSCFNYRVASGGSSLSQHAYGRAIDINPQQNPFISNGTCYHENAMQYLDRTSGDPHVIVGGDECYNIFEKYGFAWGGAWSEPIDYQHFEKRAG